MENNSDFLSASYWDERYDRQQTGWDIGYASTPLKEYIDQLTDKPIRILIPGAGNAYEARYLSEKGFTDITVLDISAVVISQLQVQLGDKHPAIKLVTGDFFDHAGTYDLIHGKKRIPWKSYRARTGGLRSLYGCLQQRRNHYQ